MKCSAGCSQEGIEGSLKGFPCVTNQIIYEGLGCIPIRVWGSQDSDF